MQSSAKFTAHIFLAAMGLIVYHQAQAARIEPAGSAFTAQGPISFSKASSSVPIAPSRWPARLQPMARR